MGGIREIIAVVVAADSPAGRIAQAIDDMTAHLPTPEEPRACPLCSARSWPCARFHEAAHRVQAAGVRVGELVPLDLHARLWPSAPTQPASPQHSDTWFDQDQHDG
jgi:hypothetical protein